MSEKPLLKVGSRQSELALIQTNYVIAELKKLHPEMEFEIVSMSTKGDQIVDMPLPKIGEKSLFTKELECALLENSVDFLVHSLKDLPTCLPDGLTVGAVLRREDPRDALITTKNLKNTKLKSLPAKSVLGTSSLRRTAQLRRQFPSLTIQDIRGNLNTRLRKLDYDKKYSGIVLALAGIKRMGWEDRVTEIISDDEFLYAVGQGALAVECRADDCQVLDVLKNLNDEETVIKVIAERSFLQTLGGGCTAPLAVKSDLNNDALSLTGAVWNLDGSIELKHSLTSHLDIDEEPKPKKALRRDFTGITAITISNSRLDAAFNLGCDLAAYLSDHGAREIVAEAKRLNEVNGVKINVPQPEKGPSPMSLSVCS